ncbi:MAG TPA: FtsK/SpoIIIE domain-containing protein, partial [Acidimicrobiales bacterium]|nr:FtsK/SpoIIIE domain-containing protein [Acidimicrobiales bacterium]
MVRVVEGPGAGTEWAIPTGTAVIGRDRGCDIRLQDPMVSRQHAHLHISDIAEVVDLGSANGIVVAGEAVDRAVVRPGSTVQIGDTVLSVAVVAGTATDAAAIGFNRPPVIDQGPCAVELEVPEAPEPARATRMPVFPLVVPLIMGLVLYLSTKATASLAFVLLSPLMMVANVTEQRSSGRKSYRQQLAAWQSAVDALKAQGAEAVGREIEARRGDLPDLGACGQAASSLNPTLWSRHPGSRQWLRLRAGVGTTTSLVTVTTTGGKTSQETAAEISALRRSTAVVEGVPLSVSLAEGTVGVAGHRVAATDLARSLVLQLATLHSPAELRIAVCASTASAPDWEWVKWLPHSGGSEIDTLLASSPASCAALVAGWEGSPADPGREEGAPGRPVTVMVIEDDAPLERARSLALATRGVASGLHVLWIAGDRSRLPAACASYVELTAGGRPTLTSAAGSSPLDEVECADLSSAEVIARRLAPVVDLAAADDDQSDLPTSASLLSLVGAELATDHAAVVERWVANRSLPGRQVDDRRGSALRAVLGRSAQGVHALDLIAQGPHALVGGTTGSGKSELLQSWVLSLASAYSPRRVTFLFVDYKGGSAFGECTALPHSVGIVTDLTPHLVRRALSSLRAELRFREEVLSRSGNVKDLVALERIDHPETPPRLVIVVDEFAALVQEVPEFVDGVVDVAQRGRSLGLHLILATQRPAGVIRDNLRANTNLRLALRVADAADSLDVVNSPVAATFDPSLPGRAVSRTGPQALVPFQAAYVGGWTSDRPPAPTMTIRSLGWNAPLDWEVPADQRPVVAHDGPNDLKRLVASIGAAATSASLSPPRRPWLAELPGFVALAELPSERRDDALTLGLADDPGHQRQPVARFFPDTDGNLAVYGTSGSGKTTVLRTVAVACGIAARKSPCWVYALDFAARGLQVLEVLPHVGSVVAGSDGERVTRLLTMLRTAIDERAARYSAVGAGTIGDYRVQAARPDEPRIILLVDGIAAFRSQYEGNENSRWFETFLSVAAEGRAVGVHVVVSADRPGAVPVALGANLQRRVVLRMADPADYSSL